MNRRKPTAGQRIIRSVQHAIEFGNGVEKGSRHASASVPDARTVRRKLKLTQSEFAQRFGLPTATIQNWEQGRTKPDAPARLLLAVIARHPDVVEERARRLSAGVAVSVTN